MRVYGCGTLVSVSRYVHVYRYTVVLNRLHQYTESPYVVQNLLASNPQCFDHLLMVGISTVASFCNPDTFLLVYVKLMVVLLQVWQ